eukprot:2244034-Pyramimonas_sp.AAC.1
MKNIFQPKTVYREALVDKRIVCKLHGYLPQAANPWEAAERLADGRSADAVDIWEWHHIGSHTFTPYHSCFHPLGPRREGHVEGPCEP